MKNFVAYFFKFLLFSVLLFVVFYFWASAPNLSKDGYTSIIQHKHSDATPNDSILTIVTYNIGYLSGMTNNRAVHKPKELFTTNLQSVKENFRVYNPDIIAFQEIDYSAVRSYDIDQEEEIATLGYNYVAKGINWDKRYLPFPYWPPSMHFGKVISGQSVLSKFPVKEYQRIVLDRVQDIPFYRDAFYLDRLLQIVTVDVGGRDLVVMNVHLEAFDKTTRQKQMQKVIDVFIETSREKPTILLGDFNSDPRYENAAIQQLLQNTTIGNAAFSEESYEMTFDTEQPLERLDYIFYTKKDIKYIEGKVLTQFGQASDHLPVAMKFSWK